MALKYSFFAFTFSFLLYLSLTVFPNVHAQNQKCEKQETYCNANCSAVVACIGPGMDPITLKPCPANKICKVDTTNNKAECNGDPATDECKPKTPAPSITCGSVGEIPHPTECGSTIICKEQKGTKPDKCDCPAGSFPDLSRPSLPCKTGSCSRKPVTCDTVGKMGSLQENSDYCYICVPDSIVVYICDGSAKTRALPDLFRANNAKVCAPTP